jgi:hypothetical protein
MVIPWPVTKVKAMNIHSIQPFNDEPQRTNIHHTFFYILTWHFRCPNTWDDSWEGMSLFVGQGKSIHRYKANVQLYSAMNKTPCLNHHFYPDLLHAHFEQYNTSDLSESRDTLLLTNSTLLTADTILWCTRILFPIDDCHFLLHRKKS